MRILFIADIVGSLGRAAVAAFLPGLRRDERPDFIIANAENAAGGKGLTRQTARELFDLGINVLTMGNHTFDRREIIEIMDDGRILRPANYPPGVPGQGWGIYTAANNEPVAVVSVMGRVHLYPLDCPFRAADAALERIGTEAKVVFVDAHAEATSEKQALARHLDGRVTAIIGTHTHVPTADECVRQSGTAYQTDAGMTGPSEGIIGMAAETALGKFMTGIPHHFVEASGAYVMQGCVVDCDPRTGRATAIRRYALNGR